MFNLSGFLIVSVALILIGSGTGDQAPEIKVLTWIEGENQAWRDDVVFGGDEEGPVTLVNRSTYILTNEVLLIFFLCTAPYPVEWDFSHSKWLVAHHKALGGLYMSSRRVSKDINDPKTFIYWSQIGLYGDANFFNGNYACKKPNDPSVQSNITVFWEGGPLDNVFVLSGASNLTIWVDPSDKIIFPCYVRDPFAEVVLLQDNVVLGDNGVGNDSWVEVPISSKLIFKPEVGFVFQKRPTDEWMDPGIYKCMAKDGSDSLLLNFVPKYEDKSPVITNAPITAPASLKRIDASLWWNTFECCSNSEKPPAISVLNCDSPSMCKMLQPAFKNQVRREVSVYVGVSRSNGSCSVYQSWGQGLSAISLVRCVGDGINAARQFYQTNSQNLTYYDWDPNTLQKWIEIDVMGHSVQITGSNNYQVYTGESKIFNCKAPSYFFSYGIRWTLKFKDGTIESLPDTIETEKLTPIFILLPRGTIERTVNVNITSNLDSLTCHVPVWNSTEWVTKSLNFSVKEPRVPTVMENSDNEDVFWTLHETERTLICKISGDPEPIVIWTKYDKIGSSQLYNVSRHHDGLQESYILKISQVTHDAQGEYKCTAINFAGRSEKTFSVFVEESHVTQITTTVVVTLVVLLLVIGGLLIVKKTILQKKSLEVLRESVPSPNSQEQNVPI